MNHLPAPVQQCPPVPDLLYIYTFVLVCCCVQLRSPSQDNREADSRGILWLLDEEALASGATDDSFLDLVYQTHGADDQAGSRKHFCVFTTACNYYCYYFSQLRFDFTCVIYRVQLKK